LCLCIVVQYPRLLLAAFCFVLLVILSVVRFLNNPGYCISRSLLLSLVWCWKCRRRRRSSKSVLLLLLLCFLFCIACVSFFGGPISRKKFSWRTCPWLLQCGYSVWCAIGVLLIPWLQSRQWQYTAVVMDVDSLHCCLHCKPLES